VAGNQSAPDDNSSDPVEVRTGVDDRAPYAKAIDKASQVTTAALMLALPMLLGYWLDKYLATTPLFVILGLLFGMVSGTTQLIRIVKSPSGPRDRRP
jgi:F0F1-type ATP synthase assembly protein I